MHTVGKGKKTTFKNLKAFTDTLLLGDLSESLDEVTDSWLGFFRPPKDLEILWNSLLASIFENNLLVNIIYHLSRAVFHPLWLHWSSSTNAVTFRQASSMSSPPAIADGWEISELELWPVLTSPGQLAAKDEVFNSFSCDCKTRCTAALCLFLCKFCLDLCKCMGKLRIYQNPMKPITPGSDRSGNGEPVWTSKMEIIMGYATIH